MKHLWKHLTGILIAFTMLFSFLPVQAAKAPEVVVFDKQLDVTLYSYNAKHTWNETHFANVYEDTNKTQVKNLKSSTPSVVSVKRERKRTGKDESDYGKYVTRLYFIARKPGSTTVSFQVGSKTYRVKVRVRKYQNPVSSVKIGNTKIAGNKFNFQSNGTKTAIITASLSKYRNKNVKISVTPVKGWKVSYFDFYNDWVKIGNFINPSPRRWFKNNQSILFKYKSAYKNYSPCLGVALTNTSTKQVEFVRIDIK